MVTRLHHDEVVRLDRNRLEQLYAQLGPSGADGVICRAMEELAARLAKAEKLYRRNELNDLQRAVRSMVAIAEQIGMMCFASVARDVADLTRGTDSAGLAACMARLIRIGEGSLMAVWDLQDASI